MTAWSCDALTHTSLAPALLQPMFDRLQQQVLSQLSKHYFPGFISNFDGHHSFIVRYKDGEDRGLDMHGERRQNLSRMTAFSFAISMARAWTCTVRSHEIPIAPKLDHAL